MGNAFTVKYWNAYILQINNLRINPPSFLIPSLSPLSYATGGARISKEEIRRIQIGLLQICPSQPYTNPLLLSDPVRLDTLYIDELDAGIATGWCQPIPTRLMKMELRWSFTPLFDLSWVDMYIADSGWTEATDEYVIGRGASSGPLYSNVLQKRVYYSDPGTFDYPPGIGMYGDVNIQRFVTGTGGNSFYFSRAAVSAYKKDFWGEFIYHVGSFCALPLVQPGETTFNLYPNQFALNDGGLWNAGRFEWDYSILDSFWQTFWDGPGGAWNGTPFASMCAYWSIFNREPWYPY